MSPPTTTSRDPFSDPAKRQQYIDETFDILEGWLAILAKNEEPLTDLTSLTHSIISGISQPSCTNKALYSTKLCSAWLGRLDRLIKITINFISNLRSNSSSPLTPHWHQISKTLHQCSIEAQTAVRKQHRAYPKGISASQINSNRNHLQSSIEKISQNYLIGKKTSSLELVNVDSNVWPTLPRFPSCVAEGKDEIPVNGWFKPLHQQSDELSTSPITKPKSSSTSNSDQQNNEPHTPDNQAISEEQERIILEMNASSSVIDEDEQRARIESSLDALEAQLQSLSAIKPAIPPTKCSRTLEDVVDNEVGRCTKRPRISGD